MQQFVKISSRPERSATLVTDESMMRVTAFIAPASYGYHTIQPRLTIRPIIYKVYLNPSRPSMILPPRSARLLANQNLRFRSSETITIRPAAIMQAVMPGT
jgi:hypothetical protein